MPAVKLETCYGWTCPGCKTRNYGEGVLVELTAEDRAEIEDREGIDLSDCKQTGELVCHPEEVTCRNCDREYETFDPRGNDEESEL